MAKTAKRDENWKEEQDEWRGYVNASLEDMKERLSRIEKNTDWLLVKVGGISSVVSVIGTLITQMILK